MFRIFGPQYYVKRFFHRLWAACCSLYSVSTVIVNYKSKGTVHAITSHEGTEGDTRYNSIALFFLQPRR